MWFDKFTATVAKRYKLTNKRFADAKIDLKKSKHLVQVGQSKTLYSKYAKAVLAA